MKKIDIKQGSPEWFEARRGKLTASNAQAIASAGKGLDTYIRKIIMEYKYPNAVDFYTNEDIERGNEQEATARGLYELETGLTVEETGLVIMNDYVSASPDGITEKGLVEIKCPNNKNHYDFILDRKIAPAYEWQMLMQMLVCDKTACDFVSYNENFGANAIIIKTYKRDEEKIKKLKAGLEKGTEMLKKLLK